MSVNKKISSKIHDEYMEENEITINDIYDQILKMYTEDSETSAKDICNKSFDEYMQENETFNKFLRYNDEKVEKPLNSEKLKICVNCNLDVDFDTKNKMIYLYPGKSQYFTVNVSKSCGDVTIKYKGCYTSKGIRGNLGIYRIVESGIVVDTYCKLDPRKKDFLNFIAIDECTKECYDFVVVFSSNSCRYCY